MQGFVKTLQFIDTIESIAGYKKVFDEIWPEIVKEIREVGISVMEIYLLGYLAVMIMESENDIDVDEAMDRLSRLLRQEEWERFVSRYQRCMPNGTSAGKWEQMERIFQLP